MRTGQSTRKRPVYINGAYCESIAAGTREAQRITGAAITQQRIARALKGGAKIAGIDVSETAPEEPQVLVRVERSYGTLLRYPYGESPLERGLPGIRR